MANTHTHKNEVLADILKYLLYASALVPLIIFREFISPFHFGKVVIFRSLVEVMLVIYTLLIIKDRSYWPKFNFVTWSFLAFALAFSLTTVTSIIPYASFWGSLERMGGVFTFWHYFIYFIILISVFKKEEDWIKLFNLTISVGIISAFYGFLQRTDASFIIGSGGRSRIFGTLGNPALFAGYEVLILFLSLMLFPRKENSIQSKYFYGSSVIISTIAVLMTAVRGSILGIGVGFLVYALFYSSVFKSRNARKAFVGLVSVLILFVAGAMMFKDSSFIKSSPYLTRVTDFSSDSYTVQTRFWAWEAGIKGWSETGKTIILGWGPENFNIPFAKYFNPKFFRGPGSETLFDRAHNMFVEVLVTMGLVGLLSYLSIFISLIIVAWKKISSESREKSYGVGLIALVIAYAIHNSFIFDTSANFLVFFTVLGFVYSLSTNHLATSKIEKASIMPSWWYGLGAVMIISVSFFIYRVNILPSIANYTTTRSIVKGWSKDFKGAVESFKKAISYDVPGKYEYRNRFAQYVLEETNSKVIDSESEKIILDSIEAVEINIKENKPDYLPYLYASRLYITLGKSDPKSVYNQKALDKAKEALELSPTFVRTYYEIGQVYLNIGDPKSAIQYFKKAAELNPEVGLSWWYLGLVMIDTGQVDEGLKIVEGIISNNTYTPTESDYNRLVNLYLQKKDFGKLAFVYDRLVKARPTNPQYHASFAVALAQLGRFDEAITQAREAAKADKAFEPEAKAFVESLGKVW